MVVWKTDGAQAPRRPDRSEAKWRDLSRLRYSFCAVRRPRFGPSALQRYTPPGPAARLTLRVKRVAGGAHSADHVGLVVAVERDAKAADMNVHRARLDIDVLAPHRVEQLLAREHAAGMLHEVAQQAELRRPEMHRLAAADHAMGHEVHDDVGVVQRL